MLKLLYSLILVFALTGCVSHPFQESEPKPIEEAPCTDPVLNVQLKITDKRWCKSGGYGVDSISIYLKEDLAALIRSSVIEQFDKRNFVNGDIGALVEIDIEQFFCDVVQRKSFWNCVSEIIMTVRVVQCDGEVLYTKRIRGEEENDFEITEKYGKAKKALITALDVAMCNLLYDKVFRRAVRRASIIKGD